MINVRFCSGHIRKPGDKIFIVDVTGKVYPVTISSDNSIGVKHLAPGKYVLAYDYGKDVFIDYFTVVR
jgi:hypothetical protein